MLDVLMRAGSFIAVVLLGYCLKKIGFFMQEDFTILSRITIRITLPATIISSFAGKQIDMALLSLALLSIGCGLLYVAIGFLINRKHGREQQAFEMLNLPGYNIGTFVIPFAQSFLGPMATSTVFSSVCAAAVRALSSRFDSKLIRSRSSMRFPSDSAPLTEYRIPIAAASTDFP